MVVESSALEIFSLGLAEKRFPRTRASQWRDQGRHIRTDLVDPLLVWKPDPDPNDAKKMDCAYGLPRASQLGPCMSKHIRRPLHESSIIYCSMPL